MVLFAQTLGATEKAARWFWFKCEGCDWTNAGRPIKNWRATFACWFEAGYFPANTYPKKPAAEKRIVGTTFCLCCKKEWVPDAVGGVKPSCKCLLPFRWCDDHQKCQACCGC